MDYRKSYILTKLQNNEILKTSNLMEPLNVSLRTLKSEVREINSLLGNTFILIDDENLKVKNLETFNLLSTQLIESSNLTNYKLNKDERLVLEFLHLCFSNKFVTVEELCDLLLVSRGTILSDLKDLKKMLQGTGIKVTSLTNHGYILKGEQLKIKQRVLEILYDYKYRQNQFLKREIENILYKGIDLDYFGNQMLSYTEQKEIILSDDKFYRLMALVIVYVKCLCTNNSKGKGQIVQEDSLLNTCLKAYDSTMNLYESTQELFVKECDQLLTENTMVVHIQKNADEQMKISSYIWKVCQDFDIIALFGYENYRNLYSHIELTIQYLTEKKTVSINPFCEELKAKYPEIFKSLEQNVYIIQDLVDRKFDENEISYMAMHIASVIEGRKPNKSSLTAVIVCPSGRCTSLLLKARILKYFNITILDILPAYKVNEDLNVDFVISTVPLHVKKIPVVQINQMLSETDIDNLEKQIDKMLSTRNQKYILDDIQCYLEKYQEITSGNTSEFDRKLTELNREYNPEEKANLLYFYKALDKKHILLDSEISNWEDSIRISGKLLLDDGYLENSYIEKMISLVKENGPYIVFSPGFVIAHAGPEDGAKELGVSLIRLKNPIDFGVEDIKVKFIICMSIPNEINHVFLLFQIYKCMCNTDIFKYLSLARTKDEFLQILKIFELRSQEL